ncbi:MAG: hypothetical protein LBC96_00235 [Lachnospiraceae bacterium]|nr:hypothetical protein [Lachnospiraceae bacterium]
MECVHQTIGSAALDGIIDLPPNLRNRKVQVIVLPAESYTPKQESKREIQFGFLKGVVPPLPDSFFDPLPEEELQTWGL